MKEVDYFNLDFDAPVEQKNETVLERNLYQDLIHDGFIFKNTPDGQGAAYIMPDGKFLFLEQNRQFFETDIITHGALDIYLDTHNYTNTVATRVLCQTDNAIRINDGTNFMYEVLIGLPENKLTIEQENSLIDWLYSLMSRNKYKVSVGNDIVSEAFQVYNLREVFPEEVIKKIRSYYNNGKLREAKDIKGEVNND